MSGYFKAGTGTTFNLTLGKGTTLANNLNATFNLSTQTVGSITYNGTAANGSTRIQAVGNGWYRCSITGYIDSFTTLIRTDYILPTSSTINVWGLQLEIGGLTIYEATGANAIPSANILSKLDSSGNYYISGILDEVTFNPIQTDYRKNTLTASNAFNNTNYWSQNAVTPIPNATIAPDGTTTAYLLRESNTSNVGHFVQQVPTWQNGYRYTYSIYAKAATRNYLFLLVGSDSIPGQQNATYNLNTGVVSGIYNVAQGTTASMQAVGNGWWRCSLTTPAATKTGTSTVWASVANDTPTINYTGDGVSGIYIWGAQIEQGTTATIYAPTSLNSLTPTSNALSKLDSSGNYYTLGTLDEVTFNPNSGYKKNLFPYSQQLNNAPWAIARATIGLTNIVAPDNTSTATQIVEEDKVPEGQVGLYKILANYEWWQNNIKIRYALSKADTKELVGIGKEFDSASSMILSLAVSANSASKEGAINTVKGAANFLCSGGAYLQIRALLNSYEREFIL
jgi:hypothetical protein